MADKKITINSLKAHKDRAQTEEKLVAAAEHIFSIHGYNAATTRMIAQKADVNIALINRYFDGKYGLLIKVIKSKSRLCGDYLDNYPVQNTLTQECTQYFLKRLEFYYEDTNFFRIILAQYLTDPKFAKKSSEIIANLKDEEGIIDRINKLKKDKKITLKVDSREFVDYIMCALFGMFIGEHLLQNIEAEEIRKKLRSFIKTLCRPYEANVK